MVDQQMSILFVVLETMLSKALMKDYIKYQFSNTCMTQAILTFSRKESQQV